jgi:hypothetical protein
MAGTFVEGFTESGFAAATVDFNILGKKKQKKQSATLPANKSKVSGKVTKTEEKTKNSIKPPKGKQSKKDSKNKRVGEEDEDNNTLMKRRRKTELQVQVSARHVCWSLVLLLFVAFDLFLSLPLVHSLIHSIQCLCCLSV